MWGSDFTTKTATLQEDSSEFVPSFCVCGLGSFVARARVFVHEVIGRGAQAVVRGGARCASRVLDRSAQAQAVARGAARCASQVLDRCTRPLPAAPLAVRCRYLIVVPRPLPAAPLVVYRRCLIPARSGTAALARPSSARGA